MNPTERLEAAGLRLEAAQEQFSKSCGRIQRRLEACQRIPAIKALSADLLAFGLGVDAVQSSLTEFVDAMKDAR